MSTLKIEKKSSALGDFTITIPETNLTLEEGKLGDFYPVEFLIDGTSYNLEDNIPLVPSILEQRQQEILNEMNLGEVINNLNLCADLLYLAFNGVAGELGLQKDISDLQSELEKLCSEAALAMQSFKNECERCMTNMVTVYQCIFNCEEEAAFALLEEIGASASKMADTSQQLANKFETMADKAQKIHGNTIERRNVRSDASKQKAKERREQVAKLKAASAKLGDITEEIEEATEELKEAKEDAKEAQIRELVMGLSAVVSNGVGAVASTVMAGMTAKYTIMTNAVAAVASTRNQLEDQQEKEKKPVKEAKDKAEEAKEILEEKEGEVEVLETTLKDLQEKKEAEEKEEKKEALQEKIEAQEEALLKKKKEKELAEKKHQAKAAAYQSAQETFDKKMEALNTQLNKQQDFAVSAAAAARKEIKDLRTHRSTLRKEKRDILGSIKEFTESIENAQTEEDILRITVESLNQAIMALSKVVATLKTATHFWKALGQYCAGLSKPSFKTKLSIFQKFPAATKLKRYYDPAFLAPVIDYAIRWKALHNICTAYSIEANKARKKVLNNIEISSIENASIDGARRLAPALAKSLLGYVKDEEERYSEAEKREREAEEQLLKETEALTKKPAKEPAEKEAATS
jgi:chromosome segregation ATPase